ncbi:MAG: polyphosphate kinase 1 [Acidimicrobiia bacterium]
MTDVTIDEGGPSAGGWVNRGKAGRNPEHFFNRELSWLDFNRRVLALAGRGDLPLLEWAKFLAITQSNLDEFFQVRVAGLMEQVAAGVTQAPADGMTPSEQLSAIAVEVQAMYEELDRVFVEEFLPAIATQAVTMVRYDELAEADRRALDLQFRDQLFPVLTPLAVDPSHPFPYISDLSLNLAVRIRDPEGETKFARVKVPPILDRFLPTADGTRFVRLEDLIAAHLGDLFPGMEIVDHHPFRVTRNADIEVEEDEADDLLEAIATEIARRRFGRVVRLEVHPGIPAEVLDLLKRELQIDEEHVYQVDAPLDLTGLWGLYGLDRPELKWPSFHGVTPSRLIGPEGEPADVFEVLKEGDLLVQHPYDAFDTTVLSFIETAARDPQVLAIKQTLYRTEAGSKVVAALMEAARRGKQVVALVELKARFDEEANINWAQMLEKAGVHVVYGLVGLKTHTKIALVVREEEGRVARYAHVGTGNYNGSTAKLYEDLGVLTADDDIGADLSDLFNFMTGYSRQLDYRALVVAPTHMEVRIIELIRRESHPGGRIVLKFNSLVDVHVIEALYEASQAGAEIDLVVRGICCLRPGVPGLSDNIRVRSIVGRYLEHSRIYRFGTSAADRVYLIGSADLMSRNLHRRVEACVAVDDPSLTRRLDEILDSALRDDVLAWELHPDGTWTRVPGGTDHEHHAYLQAAAQRRP